MANHGVSSSSSSFRGSGLFHVPAIITPSVISKMSVYKPGSTVNSRSSSPSSHTPVSTGSRDGLIIFFFQVDETKCLLIIIIHFGCCLCFVQTLVSVSVSVHHQAHVGPHILLQRMKSHHREILNRSLFFIFFVYVCMYVCLCFVFVSVKKKCVREGMKGKCF